jgi:hypothetical protein
MAACGKHTTFIPSKEDFTVVDWWLSVLHHSQHYTSETVRKWHSNGRGIMPYVIYKALNRLDLQRITNEYRKISRDSYPTENMSLEDGTIAIIYQLVKCDGFGKSKT